MKSVFKELMAGRVASAEYYDNPAITKSGSERIIAWHNAVLADDNGAIVGTLSSGLDITERKQSEESLRKSEARSRQLADVIELSSQPFGMGYLDGSLGTVNTAYCHLVGYSPDELRRLDWRRDLTPLEWQAIEAQHLDQLVCTRKPIRYEKEYIRKGGSRVPVELLVHLTCDESGAPQYYYAFVTDLTERKQAEEALRSSETTLRALLDASPESIFLLDANGTLLLANQTTARRLDKRIDEVVGRTLSDVLPAGLAAERMRRISEVFSTDKAIAFEDHRAGRHFLTAVHPIFDDQGQVAKVAVLSIDQTDRKRAEAALQNAHDELEQKIKERTADLSTANDQLRIFRMFMEASGQGFGMADLDGYITYWNPTLCRLFGEDRPEDVVGKHVSVYYPTEYVERRQNEILPAVIRDGHWQGELLVYSRQGKATPILQNTFLIRNEKGNPVRLAAAIADISELKRAEEALQGGEERFRSYFVQGLLGMAVTAVDKQWREVNDRLCDILGYSREELLKMKWTEPTHPDDLEAGLLEFSRMAAGEIDHYTQDKRFVRKDGRLVHATVFIRCFRGADGNIDHILALIEDITERKQAQEALERERQSLWKMLQASDHERQLIAYEIHDELAQLMTGAIMQFQAYENFKKNHPAKAKTAFAAGSEMLQMAHAEARRLISGVRPPVLDEAGLETAIAHLVHDRRALQGPEVEYKSKVQFHRLPAVLEDSLYRIVQEALTNACKHSESEKVTLTLSQEGQEVRLEVQDWGAGFDPESVEKGHFGLEGIRQRVRLLGGQLKIESTPGSGTLIQAVVPIVERKDEG